MTPYRPPYRSALGAFAAVLALYVATLAPTTAFWDASEYIATAHILGIPHPPGNPLFVFVAKVWSLLLAPTCLLEATCLPVAVRINLFAAATSAAGAAFFFLVAHRVLWAAFAGAARGAKGAREPGTGEEVRARRLPLVGAWAAVVISATAFTVWNQSNVNEKVYTVSVMVIAAASWLALRWRDRRHEPGSVRYLLAAAYLVVLGSTNHLMSVLPVPALAAFVLLVDPGVLRRRDLWVRVVPLVLLGLSFNLVLPVRAALRPVINEADPTCESVAGAVVAVYTQGKAGCPALAGALTREQYAKPPLSERQAPIGAQLVNWFQYFDWQWARGLAGDEVPGNARLPVTLVFLLLGAWGLVLTWRADREAFAYLAVLMAALTVGLVWYLNFKYGYSIYPEVVDRTLHEVRERDYFFIAGFAVWGMSAGIGLAAAWDALARRLSGARAHAAAAPILAVALLPLALNWNWASRAGDYAARDWAYDLLMSVEPYGVLFTNGDNDTFPLWYLQEVEGIRKDVTVIVVQYLFTSWYPKQLQELTVPARQRPFLAAQGAGVHEPPERRPARPILSLAPSEMDLVAGGTLGGDFVIPLGQIAVSYASGTTLNRGELMALAIIRDSIDERPVYFAGTTGLLNQLGLQPWGVRNGLAAKLSLRDPERDPWPGVTKVAPQLGGEWFDVERSLALVRDVYTYRGLRDRDIWADRATLNIPWHFYFMFVQLADAAERTGEDPSVVAWLREEAEAFRRTAESGRGPGV